MAIVTLWLLGAAGRTSPTRPQRSVSVCGLDLGRRRPPARSANRRSASSASDCSEPEMLRTSAIRRSRWRRDPVGLGLELLQLARGLLGDRDRVGGRVGDAPLGLLLGHPSRLVRLVVGDDQDRGRLLADPLELLLDRHRRLAVRRLRQRVAQLRSVRSRGRRPARRPPGGCSRAARPGTGRSVAAHQLGQRLVDLVVGRRQCRRVAVTVTTAQRAGGVGGTAAEGTGARRRRRDRRRRSGAGWRRPRGWRRRGGPGIAPRSRAAAPAGALRWARAPASTRRPDRRPGRHREPGPRTRAAGPDRRTSA